MAKPIDNDNKNPNNKKGFEMTATNAILLSNVILIIVIVVSMITTYSLLNHTIDKKISQIVQGDETTSEEEENTALQEGILLDLGDFILNLADTAHRRYLKVGIALELSKTEEEIQLESQPAAKPSGHGAAATDPMDAVAAEMERYKPAIRDAVISVLSNKTSDELSTPTGKELAKEEILEMVNGIFAGQREVMRVSFGQFIIQ